MNFSQCFGLPLKGLKKTVAVFLSLVLVFSSLNLKISKADEWSLTGEKVSFATLTSDGALNFYYRDSELPTEGSTFDGKVVENVYSNFNDTVFGSSSSSRSPWYANRSRITAINVVDEGAPMPSGAVFYGLNQLTSADLTKFDSSKCTNITKLFMSCSKLEEVNISNLDTSSFSGATTSNNGSFFSACSTLGKIHIGSAWSLKMGQSKTGGVGNLSNPSAGVYSGNNQSYKGKYLTGKWTDGTASYSDINSVPLNVDATYSWEIDNSQSQCVVTFDANGGYFLKGITPVSTEEVYADNGQTIKPPTDTLRNPGFEFDGWFTDDALTQKWVETEPITSNMTIKAKWKEIVLSQDWQAGDFTYSASGTEVTGLTDTGKERIKRGQELDLTKADSGKGVSITGIADSQDTYGPFAFFDAEDLTKIYAPSSVKFPQTLTKIGDNAFYQFQGTSIELPSGLASIGKSAFQNSKLTSISIPASVETVKEAAFQFSNNLSSVTFMTGSDGKSSCTEITTKAFQGASITSLTLAEGLLLIDDLAFSGANETLTKAKLPTTLTTLSESAFASSASITKTRLSVKTQAQLEANTGIVVVGNGHLVIVNDEDATFTVKFETNGGSKVADQKVKFGAKATAPKNPTKKNYDFSGWYSDASLTKQFYFNTPITKDTTLYAKWTLQKINIYRFCNKFTAEHFYTKDVNEANALKKNKKNWTYEGVGWISPAVSNTAIYRFLNKYTGEHFFTLDKKEIAALKKNKGFRYEGVAWYASDSKTTKFINRFLNKATGEHFFTADTKEAATLAMNRYFSYEGVAWYGLNS